MTGWKGFNEFGNPRGDIINNQKSSLEEFGTAARTRRELGFLGSILNIFNKSFVDSLVFLRVVGLCLGSLGCHRTEDISSLHFRLCIFRLSS
jgi:hypothetical protein